MVIGSIVIPAHNEEGVLGRLLTLLAPQDAQTRDGVEFDVVVVANGCTDNTADVARRMAGPLGVRVLELGEGSKQRALNLGDTATDAFPRLYLDADVELTRRAAIATLCALGEPGALAGRPPFVYVTEGGDRWVRAFYRARSRTPALNGALWGAGCYGVSSLGRQRWSVFPSDEPDDRFVDEQFAPGEAAIVPTDPIRVHVPLTRAALLHTLGRVYAQRPINPGPAPRRGGSASTLAHVARAHLAPSRWPDLLAYVALAVAGRRARNPRNASPVWTRDETSRQSRQSPPGSLARRAPNSATTPPPRSEAESDQ